MRSGVRTRASREGFALLALLGVIAGLTLLGLASSMVAREAVGAAQNRKHLAVAAWRAEECLERARAAIGAALTERASAGTQTTPGWGALDRVVAGASVVSDVRCDLELRAAGSALDVNAVDGEMLLHLLIAIGVPGRRGDSLVDALLDWRDADDVPRAQGAERSWYEEQGRHPPRNGSLADPRELARVRGFEALPGMDSLLDVEPGRVSLAHAPLAVLAVLPGFSREAVLRVAELRERGVGIADLLALGARLSVAARDTLHARYTDLVRLTTAEPEAWILTSRASAGVPVVTAAIEVRLVRAAERAAIVRRRTWAS